MSDHPGSNAQTTKNRVGLRQPHSGAGVRRGAVSREEGVDFHSWGFFIICATGVPLLIGSDQDTKTIQRVLKESVATRTAAIRHKLSLALTFCTTLEVQIQCGYVDHSRVQLRKMRSVIDGLEGHIRGSPHIAPEILQDFERHIAFLRQRLAALDAKVGRRRDLDQ
jgi:hypothetical protein